MPIYAIAAIDEGRGIGRDNSLLWALPDDLKRFRKLTIGQHVLMGRKTLESLPGGPLKGRYNLVLSRNPERFKHVLNVYPVDLRDTIQFFSKPDSPVLWVVGGETVYRQTIPYCSRVYLTIIPGRRVADSFFPTFEDDFDVIDESGSKFEKYLIYERKYGN